MAEWVQDGFSKELVMEEEFKKSSNRNYTIKPTPIILDSIIMRLLNSRRPSKFIGESVQDRWINLGKPGMVSESESWELYSNLKDANNLFSSYQILNKLENPKMVMGGSWNDSPSLMRFGEKRAFSAEEAHSFIGFRVAANEIHSRQSFQIIK